MRKFTTLLAFLCHCLFGFTQSHLLNQSFGTNGLVVTDYDLGNFSPHLDVKTLVLPNGKYLVHFNVLRQGFILVRYNSNGTVDKSFGINGYIGTFTTKVKVQPDGKIVGIGTVGGDFVVVRYNADGTPDRSFGNEAIQIIDFGGNDQPQALLVLNSGKVLVAGKSVTPGGTLSAIARLNVNGTLDYSYDGDGKLIIDVGFPLTALNIVALLEQPDGKVLAAAEFSPESPSGGKSVVGRMNENGTIDMTFGNGGVQYLQIPGALDIKGIVQQSDSRILIAMGDLVRLLSNGQLDPVQPQKSLDAVLDATIAPDGDIVAVGRVVGSAVGVSRYHSDGTLDGSFGPVPPIYHSWTAQQLIPGVAVYAFTRTDQGTSVSVLENGQIIVGGWLNRNNGSAASFYNHLLLKLSPTGVPVTDFGDYGLATGFVPALSSVFQSIVLQNGKLLAAGTIHRPIATGIYDYYSNVVARYQINGGSDNTFGSNGRYVFDPNPLRHFSRSLALQQNGDILLSTNMDGIYYGNIYQLSTDGVLNDAFTINEAPTDELLVQGDGKILATRRDAILRYLANGQPDNSFDGDGLLQPGFNLITTALQPDGRIVAAGSTGAPGYGIVGARYLSNGAPDFSFMGTGKFEGELPGYQIEVAKIAILPNGKMLGVGVGQSNGVRSFVLGRLNTDGSLDYGFGNNGATEVLAGSANKVSGLFVLPNGKIIVCGTVGPPELQDIAVIRFNADGSIDNGFGDNGKKVFDLWASNDDARSAVLVGNDLYIAGGMFSTATRDYAVDGSRAFIVSVKVGDEINNLVNNKLGMQQAERINKGFSNNELQVTAAPNPTSGNFNLYLRGSNQSTVLIRVTDASGRVVEQINAASTRTVSFGSNYKSGIYYAEIIQDGKRKTVPLIKAAQ